MNRTLLVVLIFCTFRAVCMQGDPPGLLYYRDANGHQVKVRTPEDWEQKRQQILRGMEAAMGALPQSSASPPRHEVLNTLKRQGYELRHIRLAVTEEEYVPAYLYIPHQKTGSGKHPAMLALHGTGSLGKRLVDGESPRKNRAYARELAERGYVVIAPDYPSMGELSDYNFSEDRYQSGTMKAIVNHMRCVDLLQALPEVDPERIGVIGHSLGGHNAMFVAAFDRRLKVIVASCGWTMMDYYDIGDVAEKQYGGRLGPWAQDRYMPLLRERYGLDGKQFPFDFHEVIAALAPRHFFSNSPAGDANFDLRGVKAGIEKALPVYRFLGAEDHLQFRYPDAGHDFPEAVRLEAYRYIDQVLEHQPLKAEISK